jgi:hypothetical protein
MKEKRLEGAVFARLLNNGKERFSLKRSRPNEQVIGV